MSDVVDTLLDAEEGDELYLEANYYEWTAPFTVTEIEPHTFAAPDGGVWIAKRITVNPMRGNASAREFDIYPDADAPDMGSGYGALTGVEYADDRDARENDGDVSDRCPWLERPADEIVDTSTVSRDLEEVLNDVERNGSVLDVHKRLAAPTLKVTKEILWQLGLRDETGRLLEDDVLELRIGEMREVFC